MPCIHCCVGCWFIFQMGTVQWNKLEASKGSSLFCWSPSSTYITCPPFFEDLVSLVRTGQFGQNWSVWSELVNCLFYVMRLECCHKVRIDHDAAWESICCRVLILSSDD